MHKVKVAINRSWKDKAIPFDYNIPDDHPDWERQGNQAVGWANVEITLQQLFDEIQQGHAVCCHLLTKDGEYVLNKFVGYRNQKSFVCTDVVLVDIDSGMTVDEALNHPFYEQYGTGLYTSPSHTPDAHRFRLVFRLEEEVTTALTMRSIQTALIALFGGDEKTKDAARLFYGSRNCLYDLNEERFIPCEAIAKLLKLGRGLVKKDREETQVRNRELTRQRYTSTGKHYLDPDKPLYKDDGKAIYLHEIKGHISGVYCPFHEPDQQGRGSEFVDVNAQGVPFFVCKKCEPDIGSSVWPRFDSADVRFINKLKGGCSSFSSIEIYDSRHVKVIPRRDGVTFLRSPKGTGKTYQLRHIVKGYKVLGQRVLLIGHRVQLLNAMAKKLELDFYKEKGRKTPDSQNHYAICVNSLPRISALRKPYDAVILDESEQVLQHLVGGTISREERKDIVSRFHRHIRDAKAVYCLDADLGELTTEAIRDLRGPDDDYHAILNEYKCGGKVNLYQNRTNIVAAIHEAIRTTFPVFITSNSRKFIDSLSLQLRQDEIKYFKITSENSESSEVAQFIEDIDNRFKNCRAILATPALGTGVDIQARCSHVFGVFEANVNTHYDFDQQLWRVRNADEVSVFIAPQTFQHPTDAHLLKEDMLANYKQTNERLGYEDNGGEKPEWYDRVLTLYCHVHALQNMSKNRLRDNFVALKQSHGYQIEWIEKYEEELEDDEDYSEIWEMEKAERAELLLSAAPCESSSYALLKHRRDKTKEQKAQCLRYEIEHFYLENLNDNPNLIDHHEDGLNLNVLKYEEFVTPIEDLIEWDLLQRESEVHLIDLDDHTQRVEMVEKGLTIAGFRKPHGEWNMMDEFCKEDMDSFVEWVEENESALNTILDMGVGRVATEPMRTVNSLLKETGMKAGISNRERVDGMTLTYYQLSEERYRLLEKYRVKRMEWKNKLMRENSDDIAYLEFPPHQKTVTPNESELVGELTP